MKNNLLLTAVILLLGTTTFSTSGLAQIYTREDLKLSEHTPADLLTETQELKISDEATIQKKNPAPHLFVGFSAGLTNLGSFDIPGGSNVTHYSTDHYVPTLGFAVQDYPSRWGGRWGWLASGAYTYAEFNGMHPIATHVAPVSVAAAYRYKISDRQLVIPYAELGPVANFFFQRGLDQDNTSGVAYGALGTLGASLNLNELGLFDGRNSMEVNLQYSRSFLGFSTTAFNADTVSAGITMVF